VMRRRLLRAQELLASTELPLIDIALATGFADQSHFSRRFHQMMGVPPRAFRLQHR
jgi:AraC family transcriptional regulator